MDNLTKELNPKELLDKINSILDTVLVLKKAAEAHPENQKLKQLFWEDEEIEHPV